MTGPQYVPQNYAGSIDNEEIRQMVCVLLHQLTTINVNLFQIRVYLSEIVQNQHVR